MMIGSQRRKKRVVGAVALIAALLMLVGGGGLAALFGIGRHTAAPAVRPDAGIMHDADNAPGGPASALIASKGQLLLPSAQEGHESKPYLALFVLDGARPDYFNVPGIPHIRALMKHGTQYTNAFAGILESETPTGHASISSGSNPSADGILSFAWANEDNTTVNLFDPANIRNGQMERILHNAPAPSIAGLVHAADPSAEVVALGGHKYYADDALG
ncbi:MAG: alkaline phosphatase family protein, partial [Chloroflexota bacterium]|nr:alkaline phosphatase family protein [Chloroflexota bacterium]